MWISANGVSRKTPAVSKRQAFFLGEGEVMTDWSKISPNKIAEETVKLTDALCTEIEAGKTALRAIAEEMRQIVNAMAREAEACPQADRFGSVCASLERFETVHCRFAEKLNEYFQLEARFLLVKRLLCQWESFCAEDAHLHALTQRTEQVEQTYLQKREAFDELARIVLPRFLEQIYQVTDGENGGAGFRLSALCLLCNEFCNALRN